MARRAVKKEERRAKLRELGGAEWLLAEVASGRTEVELAREVTGLASGGSRRQWTQLRRELVTDEQMKAARKDGAQALIDMSAAVLEEVHAMPEKTTVDVNLARARADNCLKRAAMWNPEDFGKRQARVDVNLSLSGVFVQALSDLSRSELDGRMEVAAGDAPKRLESGETG